MENKRAMDAISDSNDWLKSAEIQIKNGLYSKALYSLEMSLEIALKAIMISLNADSLKSHNVIDAAEKTIEINKDKISIGFIKKEPEIKNLFILLLMYRNASGYSFDSNISKEEFKKKSEELVDKVISAVEYCGKEVKRLNQ